MYKVYENTDSIEACRGCFENVTVLFDLKGTEYKIDKNACTCYYMLCSGQANFGLRKDSQFAEVFLKRGNVISVERNVEVTISMYNSDTKIVVAKEG